MKKNIGSVVGLYPTPVTIVGTVVDGKVNWVNIAHIGIVALDRIMLSIHKSHHSNNGIKENKTASVNLVTEQMLVKADYVGIVSGAKVDKSNIFEYYHGELENAPLIKESNLSMECELVDIYETEAHEHFILKVVNTYVDEDALTENGKVDYEKVSPVLFEMPLRRYFDTGETLGECWNVGKGFKVHPNE